MFLVRDCEHVNAPVERCFRLATNLALVADVLEMRTVAHKGFRTEGFVQEGDRVRWEGWKFGLPALHVSHISRFEPPGFFQDTMVQGRFKYFQHDHNFTRVGDHTLMLDYVRFSMPLGIAGRLAGRQIVMPHVVKLLRTRLTLLKRIAESDEWRRYLPDEGAEPVSGFPAITGSVAEMA